MLKAKVVAGLKSPEIHQDSAFILKAVQLQWTESGDVLRKCCKHF